MSHGPYKLTEYQEDKSIVLERNENGTVIQMISMKVSTRQIRSTAR